jgi:hypothetical protein
LVKIYPFFQCRQTASAKVDRTNGGFAGRRGIGDFAEGADCANVVGEKIPACVVLNTVRHGLVRNEAFCQQALWLIDGSN